MVKRRLGICICLSLLNSWTYSFSSSKVSNWTNKDYERFLGFSSNEKAKNSAQQFVTLLSVSHFDEERCAERLSLRICEMAKNFHSWRKSNKAEKRTQIKQRRLYYHKKLQQRDLVYLESELNSKSRSRTLAVANRALKDSSCPKNLHIATAYHLEDFLPNRIVLATMKKLLMGASTCVSSLEAKRDLLLFRGGLWLMHFRQHKEAKMYFEAALKAKSRREPYRVYYWKYKAEEALGLINEAKKTWMEFREKLPISWHQILLTSDRGEDVFTNIEKKWNNILTLKSNAGMDKKTLNTAFSVLWLIDNVEHRFVIFDFVNYAVHQILKAEQNQDLLFFMAKELKKRHAYPQQVLTMGTARFKRPEWINLEFLKLMHVRPFEKVVKLYQEKIHSNLVFSLIRQESAFDPKAISTAGAQGLMQLLPSTAKQYMRGYQTGKLLIPHDNVNTGVKYLLRLSKLMGSFERGLLSYNAGIGHYRRWEKRYAMIKDKRMFLDMVPFRETRDYVPSILRSAYFYEMLFPSKVIKSDLMVRSKLLDEVLKLKPAIEN